MRPTENEPPQAELETLLDDEERLLLEDPQVPDDVKAEVAERLERFREGDLEAQVEDTPLPGR